MEKRLGGPIARTLSRPGPSMVIALMTLASIVFVVAPAVGAVTQGFEITIPVTTVERGLEGSVIELATEDVPEEFAGQECNVVAQSENQESVHEGNDLIVESGGSQVLLPDVEAEPGGTVSGLGQLVLGQTIVVSLIMGPDEVFSAGIDVIVDCTPRETTTTTTVPEETTTVPPTTVPPSTVPPALTTTIPDEVQSTSITAPPTTPPVEVSPTDQLPFTGAESGTPALLALALIGIGALALAASRRAED